MNPTRTIWTALTLEQSYGADVSSGLVALFTLFLTSSTRASLSPSSSSRRHTFKVIPSGPSVFLVEESYPQLLCFRRDLIASRRSCLVGNAAPMLPLSYLQRWSRCHQCHQFLLVPPPRHRHRGRPINFPLWSGRNPPLVAERRSPGLSKPQSQEVPALKALDLSMVFPPCTCLRR